MPSSSPLERVVKHIQIVKLTPNSLRKLDAALIINPATLYFQQYLHKDRVLSLVNWHLTISFTPFREMLLNAE
jgi:hypothetical protein